MDAQRYDAFISYAHRDADWALAETVTLAADDVLLDALLARLDPLARQLLRGAAVYRVPVDDIGPHWQVSEWREPEPGPERERRMAETNALLTRARRENLAYSLAALSIRMGLRTPEVDIDRYWLAQQRAALGDGQFRRIAAEHLDPESVENVIDALPDADDT